MIGSFVSYLIDIIMMGVILSMSAILLVMQTNAVLGEVFTALSEMEGLVTTELELVRHLDNYIQEEEIRLKQLKR
jgi:prolyl 4-hydroxylase